MAEKTTETTDSDSLHSAPFEETPWVAQETTSEPDAATEATRMLLSEAARHSFRYAPLSEAGILVKRF